MALGYGLPPCNNNDKMHVAQSIRARALHGPSSASLTALVVLHVLSVCIFDETYHFTSPKQVQI